MLPKYLDDLVDEWAYVGSRYTCNPPPTDTDLDMLLLLDKSNLVVFKEEMKSNKWKVCVKEKNDDAPDAPPPQIEDYNGYTEWSKAFQKWCEETPDDEDDDYDTLIEGTSDFEAYRKTIDGTDTNLIITTDEDWYSSFLEARDECKEKNVMDKKERCAIHKKHLNEKEAT